MSESGDGLCVLLIDDDEAVLTGLEFAFDDEGWDVTTANSGEAGVAAFAPNSFDLVAAFAPNSFDLVVTDKNMPNINGIDVVRTIRDRDQKVAVIMLTGYGSGRSAAETLNLGVDAYAEKPVRDVLRLTAQARAAIKRRNRRFSLAPTAPSPSHRGLILCPDSSRRPLLEAAFKTLSAEGVIVATTQQAIDNISAGGVSAVLVDESVLEEHLNDTVEALRGAGEMVDIGVIAQALAPQTIVRLIDYSVSCIIDQPVGSRLFVDRLVKFVNRSNRSEEENHS